MACGLQPLGGGEMRRNQQRRLKGKALEVGGQRESPHICDLYKELYANFFFSSGIRNRLSLQTNIYSFFAQEIKCPCLECFYFLL